MVRKRRRSSAEPRRNARRESAKSDDAAYPTFDEVDFGRIHRILRSLAFFDDVFLNMQAMNVAMVDQQITNWEYQLLREYFEIDRTPVPTAMFVSAQSQMWIFALYELLRTWRQRASRLLQALERNELDAYIEKMNARDKVVSALSCRMQAERLKADPIYAAIIRGHVDCIAPVFRMAEAIRMNLAKHEPAGNSHEMLRAPGYGRIDYFCGAMNFEVVHRDGSLGIISRRDIAEALRKVAVPHPLDQ